jgi:hypothetical protein
MPAAARPPHSSVSAIANQHATLFTAVLYSSLTRVKTHAPRSIFDAFAVLTDRSSAKS